MGPSAAWFYEGQLRLHRNNNSYPRPPSWITGQGTTEGRKKVGKEKDRKKRKEGGTGIWRITFKLPPQPMDKNDCAVNSVNEPC